MAGRIRRTLERLRKNSSTLAIEESGNPSKSRREKRPESVVISKRKMCEPQNQPNYDEQMFNEEPRDAPNSARREFISNSESSCSSMMSSSRSFFEQREDDFEVASLTSNLSSTSTWAYSSAAEALDDHLPVGAVIYDSILFGCFKDFIVSQHASESLWCWLAVQRFQKHIYSRPNTKLANVLHQARADPNGRGDEDPVSTVDETRKHMAMAKEHKVTMRKVAMVIDAIKVYDMFIKSGARMECFVKPETRDAITKAVDPEFVSPNDLDQDVFAAAAREAYITMEKDILPRFLEKHEDDPVVAARLDRICHRRLQQRSQAERLDASRPGQSRPVRKKSILRHLARNAPGQQQEDQRKVYSYSFGETDSEADT